MRRSVIPKKPKETFQPAQCATITKPEHQQQPPKSLDDDDGEVSPLKSKPLESESKPMDSKPLESKPLESESKPLDSKPLEPVEAVAKSHHTKRDFQQEMHKKRLVKRHILGWIPDAYDQHPMQWSHSRLNVSLAAKCREFNSLNPESKVNYTYYSRAVNEMTLDDSENDDELQAHAEVRPDPPKVSDPSKSVSSQVLDRLKGESKENDKHIMSDVKKEEASSKLCRNRASRKDKKSPILPLNEVTFYNCDATCRLKCASKFTEKERYQIYEEYHHLAYYDKKVWMTNNCTLLGKGNDKRRKYLRIQHNLTKTQSGGQLRSRVPVCRPFFLGSLGLKKTAGSIVRTALIKTDSNGKPLKIKRGLQNRPDLFRRNLIKEHILGWDLAQGHSYPWQNLQDHKDANILRAMCQDFNKRHPDSRASENFYHAVHAELRRNATNQDGTGTVEGEMAEIQHKSLHQDTVFVGCNSEPVETVNGLSRVKIESGSVLEPVLQSPKGTNDAFLETVDEFTFFDCGDTCPLNCASKFTDAERVQLYEEYQQQSSYHVKKMWISRHCSLASGHRVIYALSKSQEEGAKRRRVRVPVCRVFFRGTLGTKDTGKGIVQSALKKTDSNGVPIKIKVGKLKQKDMFRRKLIKDHILEWRDFDKLSGEPLRKRAKHDQEETCVKDMWKAFKEQHQDQESKVSYEFYRRMFNTVH